MTQAAATSLPRLAFGVQTNTLSAETGGDLSSLFRTPSSTTTNGVMPAGPSDIGGVGVTGISLKPSLSADRGVKFIYLTGSHHRAEDQHGAHPQPQHGTHPG